jgi:hypothetical protein
MLAAEVDAAIELLQTEIAELELAIIREEGGAVH